MPAVILKSRERALKDWRLGVQVSRVPVSGDEIATPTAVYRVTTVRLLANQETAAVVWVTETNQRPKEE